MQSHAAQPRETRVASLSDAELLKLPTQELANEWCHVVDFEAVGRAIVAKRTVPANTVVAESRAPVRAKPTVFTVAVDETTHVDVDNGIQYTAHACNPSGAIRIVHEDSQPVVQLVTVRQVQPEEKITFDYLTTEWDMAAPFDCRCGAEQCHGRVAGMKYLSPAQQDALLPRASPFVRHQLERQRAASSADHASAI